MMFKAPLKHHFKGKYYDLDMNFGENQKRGLRWQRTRKEVKLEKVRSVYKLARHLQGPLLHVRNVKCASKQT